MEHKDWAIVCTLDSDVQHYYQMTTEEATKLAVSFARLHHKRIIADLLLTGRVLHRSEVITIPLVHAIARDGEMHAVFAHVGLLTGKGDTFVAIPVRSFALDLIKREWLMQWNPDETGRKLDWFYRPARVSEGDTHYPPLIPPENDDDGDALYTAGAHMEAEHPNQERVEMRLPGT